MKMNQKNQPKSRPTLLMRALVVIAFTVFSASCSSSPCNEKTKSANDNVIRLMMLKMSARSKH